MSQVRLHGLARTTPAVREEIQRSELSLKELSKKFNISMSTVHKWKHRKGEVQDRSHTRHNLGCSLSGEEEEIAVELKTRVLLSLDDITEVLNRCINPNLRRSSIHRALQRRGVSGRQSRLSEEKRVERFEEVTRSGYIHMDVKYLTKLGGKRSYLYVGIDRYSRYVYTEVLYDLRPKTAGDFVKRFTENFPHPVYKILTDNGFEWTDRGAGQAKAKATGEHEVDQVCRQNKIKHVLTRFRRPQTNGMVERFNRRINEAIGRKEKISANQGKNSFESHQERNEFIKHFIEGYNRTRLRCLGYRSPLAMLYDNHTGDNTCAGMTYCMELWW